MLDMCYVEVDRKMTRFSGITFGITFSEKSLIRIIGVFSIDNEMDEGHEFYTLEDLVAYCNERLPCRGVVRKKVRIREIVQLLVLPAHRFTV
jgi:hypothetical protein